MVADIKCHRWRIWQTNQDIHHCCYLCRLCWNTWQLLHTCFLPLPHAPILHSENFRTADCLSSWKCKLLIGHWQVLPPMQLAKIQEARHCTAPCFFPALTSKYRCLAQPWAGSSRGLTWLMYRLYESSHWFQDAIVLLWVCSGIKRPRVSLAESSEIMASH